MLTYLQFTILSFIYRYKGQLVAETQTVTLPRRKYSYTKHQLYARFFKGDKKYDLPVNRTTVDSMLHKGWIQGNFAEGFRVTTEGIMAQQGFQGVEIPTATSYSGDLYKRGEVSKKLKKVFDALGL